MSGNARQTALAERADDKGPAPEAKTADAPANQEGEVESAPQSAAPAVEPEHAAPARAGAGRVSRLKSSLRARRAPLAGLVAAATIAVVLLLLIAIVFKVLGANSHNSIVSALLDTGNALAGPFNGMFTPSDEKLEAATNWGIALVVYYLAGQLAAKWLAR